MADMHKGTYKKPRAINTVSVAFFLLLATAGYLIYCFGPAYLADYRVREIVHEAAHRYYKLSFLEETLRAEASSELVADTRKRIVDLLGFDDEEMTVQLLIDEETKKVNIVADYKVVIVFPGTEKRYTKHFNNVGESDFVNTGN